MIVGCYSVHLYCEAVGHLEFPQIDEPILRKEFTGQNERECFQEARNAGWKIIKRIPICHRCIRIGLSP